MRDTAPNGVLYDLTEDDCWALLERAALGRLAVAAAGVVDVFPVNYAVEAGRILFKTSEGTKLASLTVHEQVAFEIDGADEQTAWSVVVKGIARVIDRSSDLEAVERHRIVSWLPTRKSRVVAIEPISVTGRGFLRGPDPDVDWY
jgi:nitroimidazol reductase NimA-like FMN-containing flavoprotein (pyridoxamine 5'-phosphate oxidase superfamily)